MRAPGTFRAILLSIAAAALVGWASPPARAQSPTYLQLTASDAVQNRPVYLGVNKSMVIELPRPAGDVLVSNPAIADAVLRTSTRLYLIGVKLGQANVFLFDEEGRQIANFDVYVEADLGALNQLLAEAIPEGFVRADAMNGNIVLRGQVPSATASSRAQEITIGMLEGASAGTDDEPGTIEKQVVNLLTITGEEQVALKVTIAEVQREVIKQLGIDTQAVIDDMLDFTNPTSFPFNTSTTGSLGTVTLGESPILPGETANFLAGGEFPVPVAADDGDISIGFKQFGVNLAFTPVVLSAGRISLKVRTEVSDLSATGSVSLPISATSAVVIPGVTVRRAETTVELPSGGAFVIAGLVTEETRRASSGLPWLQDIPVLGVLFASKDFQENQTELVMIITPYLVKPTSPQALMRPDRNMIMADDAEAYFRNRLTEVYGAAGQAPAAGAGQVGFTFD